MWVVVQYPGNNVTKRHRRLPAVFERCQNAAHTPELTGSPSSNSTRTPDQPASPFLRLCVPLHATETMTCSRMARPFPADPAPGHFTRPISRACPRPTLWKVDVHKANHHTAAILEGNSDTAVMN